MENSKTTLTKNAIALGITVIFFLLAEMRALHPLLLESSRLDPNWNTAPAYAYLHDDQVLGRDIIFSFGPLFQMISVLGAKLHFENSSVFGLHLVYYVSDQLALFLLAVCLLFIPNIDWRISSFLLLIFHPAIDLRTAFFILTATILSFSFTRKTRSQRISFSVVVGMIAFLSQLYSFDIGLYSLVLIVFSGVFFAFVSFLSNRFGLFKNHEYLLPREYLLMISVAGFVFATLNIFISIVFFCTSDHYVHCSNIKDYLSAL